MQDRKNALITRFGKTIQWLGQSAVRLNHKNMVIYIDPYQIQDDIPANIILITHSHFDHFSIEDITKISRADTLFLAPEDCVSRLQDTGYEQILTVAPNQIHAITGIKIDTVPMYNVVKQNKHPREMNWVGYVLTLNDVRLYHAGDTERIPEMKNIRCDIALVPLGQTYTMNSVNEATEAVLDVQARIAIPIHYGQYEGTEADAQEFKELLAGKVDVLILNPVP